MMVYLPILIMWATQWNSVLKNKNNLEDKQAEQWAHTTKKFVIFI